MACASEIWSYVPTRLEDGGEAWYFYNSVTGESVWELPAHISGEEVVKIKRKGRHDNPGNASYDRPAHAPWGQSLAYGSHGAIDAATATAPVVQAVTAPSAPVAANACEYPAAQGTIYQQYQVGGTAIHAEAVPEGVYTDTTGAYYPYQSNAAVYGTAEATGQTGSGTVDAGPGTIVPSLQATTPTRSHLIPGNSSTSVPAASAAGSPGTASDALLLDELQRHRHREDVLNAALEEQRQQHRDDCRAAEEAERAKVAELEETIAEQRKEVARSNASLIEALREHAKAVTEAEQRVRTETAKQWQDALEQTKAAAEARRSEADMAHKIAATAEEAKKRELAALHEELGQRVKEAEAGMAAALAREAKAQAGFEAQTAALDASEQRILAAEAAVRAAEATIHAANTRAIQAEAELEEQRSLTPPPPPVLPLALPQEPEADTVTAEVVGVRARELALELAKEDAGVRSSAIKTLKAELAESVRAELRETLRDETRSEVATSIRKELTGAITADLRVELRDSVMRSLRSDLEAAVRVSLEAELSETVRKEAAARGKLDAEAEAIVVARAAIAQEMAGVVESARAEEAAAAAERLQAAVSDVSAQQEKLIAAARQEAAILARRETEAVLEEMRAAVVSAETRWRREAALRRKAHNWALELAGNVRVFARIRPVLDVERRQGSLAATETVQSRGDEEVIVLPDADAAAGGGRRMRGGKYTFDRVFAASASQEEVFDEVEPLVVSCLDGYNATVFAYGQTGSGKTFTIQGDTANPGISVRTLRHLLGQARERSEAERRCFSLELSVLEVYNEEIRDLLAKAPVDLAGDDSWRSEWITATSDASAASASTSTRTGLLATQRAPPAPPTGAGTGSAGRGGASGSGSAKLDVRRDAATGGTQVPGLTRVALRSVRDAELALEHAAAGRSVGSHSMNEHSSRSHLVMTVYVSADALGGKQLAGIASKLHIIDLAGSERVSKTDAAGARLREAKAINKSLSALGNVMEALASSSSGGDASAGKSRGSRTTAATPPRFVPYRDSKLTFLLEDSLRGGSKVLMFANVSPSRYNAPESTTSLQFAQRCRAVQLGRASKNGLAPPSRG